MDMEGALMVLVNVCAVIHIQGMIVDRHKLVLMKVVVNCPVASNVMAMDIAKQILQYASVIKDGKELRCSRKAGHRFRMICICFCEFDQDCFSRHQCNNILK